MYSSSRGILYTAPPKSDETEKKRADDSASTDATDDAASTRSAERADELAADD